METPGTLIPSNTVNSQFTAAEFRKLALKLRWLGLEDEAERLEDMLARVVPDEFVLVVADATD